VVSSPLTHPHRDWIDLTKLWYLQLWIFCPPNLGLINEGFGRMSQPNLGLTKEGFGILSQPVNT
jgi:hypothetical protein